MDIGGRIREIREDLGMPRTVLARRVGVADNTIWRIEAGQRTPSVGLLEKIAHELRTEPAALMREPAGAGKAEAPQETGQLATQSPSLAEWLEGRCGHSYLAMTREEIEGLFDALEGTPDEEHKARDLGLQIHEEQQIFNAFPNNVSPEEVLRMRKTIRDSISRVAVNYTVALFESGLYPEYAEALDHFDDLQRTLDEDIA